MKKSMITVAAVALAAVAFAKRPQGPKPQCTPDGACCGKKAPPAEVAKPSPMVPPGITKARPQPTVLVVTAETKPEQIDQYKKDVCAHIDRVMSEKKGDVRLMFIATDARQRWGMGLPGNGVGPNPAMRRPEGPRPEGPQMRGRRGPQMPQPPAPPAPEAPKAPEAPVAPEAPEAK